MSWGWDKYCKYFSPKVLPIVSSSLLSGHVDMSEVITLLLALRLFGLGGILGFSPLLVCFKSPTLSDFFEVFSHFRLF